MSIGLLSLLLALLLPQGGPTGWVRCYKKLNEDCYYVSNKKYPGLAEFEFFWVDRVNRKSHSLTGKAYINKTFIDFTGSLNGNRFSFETSQAEDLTYKFVGVFIPKPKPRKGSEVCVEGTLYKLKGSRNIASRKVRFHVEYGWNT